MLLPGEAEGEATPVMTSQMKALGEVVGDDRHLVFGDLSSRSDHPLYEQFPVFWRMSIAVGDQIEAVAGCAGRVGSACTDMGSGGGKGAGPAPIRGPTRAERWSCG